MQAARVKEALDGSSNLHVLTDDEERRSVLVIDDEPRVASAIQRLLRAHAVTVTHSGAEALQRIQGGERYDVVLCDVLMPEMSGIDFFRALQQLGQGDEERIIFMTGGSMPHFRNFIDSVPNRWLSKPFDTDALRQAVQMSRVS